MKTPSRQVRSRSRSLGQPAPPTSALKVRCGSCSRLLPAEELERHRQFSCRLNGTTCEFCGSRCFGDAALRSHERKCAARRTTSSSGKALPSSTRSLSEVWLKGSPSSLTPLDREEGGDTVDSCGHSQSLRSPVWADGTLQPFLSAQNSSPVSPHMAHHAISVPYTVLSPPPPVLSPSTAAAVAGYTDGLHSPNTEHPPGGFLHSTCSSVCAYCSYVARSAPDAARHATVCAAAPVQCPLRCGTVMLRGEVPQHLRETASSHDALCLPSESDYGGDDPRVVNAILLSLLIAQEQTHQSCALTPNNGTAALMHETDEEAESYDPSSVSRGASPSAPLPPPTRLFDAPCGGAGSPLRSLHSALQPPIRPLGWTLSPMRRDGVGANK